VKEMPDNGIKFGLKLPYLTHDGFSQIADLAAHADRLGFHSVWTLDGVCYDQPSPLISLAAAAGATQRVRLGTAVVLSPLRDPVLLAKDVASLDVISKGRVIFGVGVGNRPWDYEACRIPYNNRGAILDEQIEVLRELWQTGRSDHSGKFYKLSVRYLGPKPVQQPHPPVWIGSKSGPALERVAKVATGWIGTAGAPDVWKESWAKIVAACNKTGRDPAEITPAKLLYISVASSREEGYQTLRSHLTQYYSDQGGVPWNLEKGCAWGRPADCKERIHELVSCGAKVFLTTPIPPSLAHVEVLWKDVLSDFQ